MFKWSYQTDVQENIDTFIKMNNYINSKKSKPVMCKTWSQTKNDKCNDPNCKGHHYVFEQYKK